MTDKPILCEQAGSRSVTTFGGYAMRLLTSEPALRLFNVFLVAAAVVAALAALTTAWPHTPLSAIWQSKEASFQALVRLRPLSTAGFALLAVDLSVAAWAWLRRLRLGWQLAAATLLVNLATDLASTIATLQSSFLLAVLLDGAATVWVFLPATRGRFGRSARSDVPKARASARSGTS